MKKVWLILLGILLGLTSYAQDGSLEIDKMYLQQDVVSLIECCEKYPTQQERIEDYLFTGIDYDSYTYEQILDFCELASNSSPLLSDFNKIKSEKEIEFLSAISQLTAEQLTDYLKQFPKRKGIINLYTQSVVQSHLDSLSYLELSYLERKSNFSFIQDIKGEKVKRKGEIKSILRNEFDSYCQTEEKQLDKLMYMMKYRALTYLHFTFRRIASSYSKVEVPEYPDEMVRQINSIINSLLKTSELDALLQQVGVNYCKAINRNRTAYLRQIGCAASIDESIDLNLKTSAFQSFSYQASIDYFNEIFRLRKELMETKNTSSSVSGVAGLFTDWAGVGRALYDYGAVSEEAQKEVKLRTEYLSETQSSMEESIEKNFNKVEGVIRNMYRINLEKFKEYVSKEF